ncbi:hypothetical protein [Microvirga antarctica]|uniref:hypothetical protein n=1 Tax=Microvirga antarctica TaxID=2819233 RepID=UPI001B300AEF|nr:hypothetical protein [Microvirga antarctica]
MIIALYALALAMIVGGLFSAILGWDIVLVERGWTMVISGIIGASSGALLVGITAVVARLTRIQEELARVQLSLEDEIETVAVPPTSAEQARGRMLGDVGIGAAAGGLAGSLFGTKSAQDSEASAEIQQPTLPLFEDAPAALDAPDDLDRAEDPAPLPSAAAYPFPKAAIDAPEPSSEPEFDAQRDDISEGQVPDFLFAERYRESIDTEVRFPEREQPSFTTSPDEELADELPVAQSAVDDEEVFVSVAETETDTVVAIEPDEEAHDADLPGGPAAVIGTYNSGENKYVMYSDGSIEAETPQGFFRFASLDELKEFIAAGGEGASEPL